MFARLIPLLLADSSRRSKATSPSSTWGPRGGAQEPGRLKPPDSKSHQKVIPHCESIGCETDYPRRYRDPEADNNVQTAVHHSDQTSHG